MSGIFITQLFFGCCMNKTNEWEWHDLVKSNVKYSKETPNNKRQIYYKIYDFLYVLVMSRRRFRVNPHSIVAWMSKNSLLEAAAKSEV